MSRVVRSGLIQATNALPPGPGVSLEAIKAAMIEKHVALIDEAGQKGVADRLPAGAVLRPLLLRRAGYQVVRADRTSSRRPDHQADAGARQEAQDGHGRAGLRRGHDRRLLQHGRGLDADGSISASSARSTSRIASRLLGEVLFHARAIWAIRSSIPISRRSAFTSATTATSRRARARSGWRAPRSCSSPRRRRQGLRVSVEDRADRPRGRQRLLRRHQQPGRQRGAVEFRRILRQVLFLRSARPYPRPGEPRQGRLIVADLDSR